MKSHLILAALLMAVSAETLQAQDVPASAPAPAAAADPAPTRDPSAPDPAPAHPELAGMFERDFGGREGMAAMIDEFMAITLEDPRTRPFFINAERTRIKQHLVEQFCALLGGGCVYTGRDMRTTHMGHAIDRADFNALIESLQVAMTRRGVPFRAQNRLLALLAPMHREVINR